ncbi:DUF2523 domain-containing protein [Aeromonas rivuli]|jgi:hypothetical protein|uniref:DUF2523 domain-containing protein n=1 Tax=Aeromonas rivuli TaxID=648794 RepID=UPI0005AA940A|nr:DUF2523 domain-containing protein [Aeromonas rivuli]
MPLAAWLLSIASPIVIRVLTQLGIGIVSFVGVEAAVNQFISLAQTHWLGLPANVLQFMAIGGFNTALGIIAGGISARLTLMVFKRFTLK